MELFHLFARLSLDRSRFEADVKAAQQTGEQAAQQVGSAWQRAGQTIEDSLRRARPASNALLLSVTGLVAGFTAAAGAAVKFNGELEQVSIGFETMLGSAEAAQAFIRDLADFAAETPFEFPGLVQASQRLLAMGFAANEIIPTMRAVGDAVAALGAGQQGIDRLVYALGQMRARGRAAAEELMQVAELGVPAWELLAQHIGVSIPEAMELVSKGAIDAHTAIEALVSGMEQRFAGLMERQSGAFLGLWSTIKDTVQLEAGKAFEPLFEAARQWMRRLADYVQSEGFERAVDRLRDGVARFVSFVEGATDRVRPFGEWLARHGDVVIPALVGAITLGLTPALYGLASAFIAAAAPISPFLAAGAAVGALAGVIIRNWQPVRNFFLRLWSELTEGFWRVVAAITDGIASAADWMANLADRIPRIGDGIAASLRGVAERARDMADSAREAMEQAARAGEELRVGAQGAADGMADLERAATQATSAVEGVGQAASSAASSVGSLKERLDAAARERAIQDALAELEEALRLAEAQASAFGDEFDEGKAKVDAYRTAIIDLLRLGLDPTDERVQSLIRSLRELQATLQQPRVERMADAIESAMQVLDQELARVAAERELARQLGQPFDEAEARVRAYERALQHLIEVAPDLAAATVSVADLERGVEGATGAISELLSSPTVQGWIQEVRRLRAELGDAAWFPGVGVTRQAVEEARASGQAIADQFVEGILAGLSARGATPAEVAQAVADILDSDMALSPAMRDRLEQLYDDLLPLATRWAVDLANAQSKALLEETDALLQEFVRLSSPWLPDHAVTRQALQDADRAGQEQARQFVEGLIAGMRAQGATAQELTQAIADLLASGLDMPEETRQMLERMYDELLPAATAWAVALADAQTAAGRAALDAFVQGLDEQRRFEEAYFAWRRAIGDVTLEEELERDRKRLESLRLTSTEGMMALETFYETWSQRITGLTDEERQALREQLEAWLEVYGEDSEIGRTVEALLDRIAARTEQTTDRMKAAFQDFGETVAREMESRFGQWVDALTGGLSQTRDLIGSIKAAFLDFTKWFVSEVIRRILVASGVLEVAAAAAQAIAAAIMSWNPIAIAAAVAAGIALVAWINSQLAALGASGGGTGGAPGGGGSGGGGDADEGGGGVQVSEITGLTRDLLVDLLTPLASLQVLQGTGERIYAEQVVANEWLSRIYGAIAGVDAASPDVAGIGAGAEAAVAAIREQTGVLHADLRELIDVVRGPLAVYPAPGSPPFPVALEGALRTGTMPLDTLMAQALRSGLRGVGLGR